MTLPTWSRLTRSLPGDPKQLWMKKDSSPSRRSLTTADYFPLEFSGDMDTQEEYSCECGTYQGKFYEGKVCPKCGKPVTFVGMSIDKYGWIDLSLNKYDDDGNIVQKGNRFPCNRIYPVFPA